MSIVLQPCGIYYFKGKRVRIMKIQGLALPYSHVHRDFGMRTSGPGERAVSKGGEGTQLLPCHISYDNCLSPGPRARGNLSAL